MIIPICQQTIMAELKWMRFLIYPTSGVYVGSFKLICQLTTRDQYRLRAQYWLHSFLFSYGYL